MTTPEILYRINMIAVLEDVQRQMMVELTPELRQNVKRMMNESMVHTRRLIKYFDQIHGQNAERLGIASDLVRDLLDAKFNETGGHCNGENERFDGRMAWNCAG